MRSFLALAGLVLAGCVGTTDEDLDLIDEQDEHDQTFLEARGKADAAADTSTFYATRPDTRRCAFPMCGGLWVSRLNRAQTRCSDGVYRSECYVAALANSTGLDDDAWSRFLDAPHILRATMSSKSWAAGTYGVLEATEAWRAVTADAPSGVFYRINDNMIRCITTPCYSLHEAKLNSTLATQLSGLTGALAADAQTALADGPVIVAGTNRRADGGKVVRVNQLYVLTAP